MNTLPHYYVMPGLPDGVLQRPEFIIKIANRVITEMNISHDELESGGMKKAVMARTVITYLAIKKGIKPISLQHYFKSKDKSSITYYLKKFNEINDNTILQITNRVMANI